MRFPFDPACVRIMGLEAANMLQENAFMLFECPVVSLSACMGPRVSDGRA